MQLLVSLFLATHSFFSFLTSTDLNRWEITPAPEPTYIALTFDDSSDKTDEITRLLNAYNQKATLFLKGDFITYKNLDTLRKYALNNLIEIGNHSQTHPYLTSLSESKQKVEIKNNQELLQKKFKKPSTYFRPPYGDYNFQTIRAAKATNQQMILWDSGSDDWVEGITKTEILNKFILNVKNNHVLILHLDQLTYETLPEIFSYLAQSNIHSLTLSELKTRLGNTLEITSDRFHSFSEPGNLINLNFDQHNLQGEYTLNKIRGAELIYHLHPLQRDWSDINNLIITYQGSSNSNQLSIILTDASEEKWIYSWIDADPEKKDLIIPLNQFNLYEYQKESAIRNELLDKYYIEYFNIVPYLGNGELKIFEMKLE
jgi:peptidoglycan/xylan/chitin deacetylase (PgdA/CDA1 family)